MVSVSLCMIVKNEEAVMARCLDTVKDLVDEINIVDTGSTDRTKEVVGKYTDRIYDFEWVDDFAAARNYAFKQATCDFILWLDADDVLLAADQEKFRKLKDELTNRVDAVSIDYHLGFDDSGNVTFSNKRNRLVKRSNQFKWIGAVHEYLEVGGNILMRDIAVTHQSIHHDSDRNLRIYEQRLAKGEKFTPRDMFYFANELTDHKQYEQANRYYDDFLATGKGWVEDNITACGKLADNYAQLKQPTMEWQSIVRSFAYDQPRAEFCCRLGYFLLQRGDAATATFWYELATKSRMPKERMGFINTACYTWLPELQLCVCYDRLGELQKAYDHNEKAREFQPDNDHVLHNKAYLEAILKETD